jgi:hypothetical protein
VIWKILSQNGRIARPGPQKPHQPQPRPEPLAEWQVDYKDATTVRVEPDGKKAHVVEVLNIIDVGTSLLVEAVARSDFNAETALQTMVEVLKKHGLPRQITFDRDPRWVGSHSSRDFPSAFVKFWHCLGIVVDICPPHRPDKNGFVERYNRSFGTECLSRLRPETLGEVREVTAKYKEHYNWQRPHQGLSCNNQPPRVAFPELPALPALPLVVDPDKWLQKCDGLRWTRKVDHRGTIKVDRHHYYLKVDLAGKYVQVEVDASHRELVVYLEKAVVKKLPLKGLVGRELSLEEYLALMLREARSERRLAALRARARQG